MMRAGKLGLVSVALTMIAVGARAAPGAPNPAVCTACCGIHRPFSCAALGEGPAPQLAVQCGADLDLAYIRSMYALHSNIGALAAEGVKHVTDRQVNRLAGKIRDEQNAQMAALAQIYEGSCSGKLTADTSTAAAIIAELAKCSGADFDMQYALAMSAMLGQARDASMIAIYNATIARLRRQATIVARSTQNEIDGLLRWIGTRSRTWTCAPCPGLPPGLTD